MTSAALRRPGPARSDTSSIASRVGRRYRSTRRGKRRPTRSRDAAAAILIVDRQPHMLDVEVDGVAVEDQHQHRQDDHHREGARVAEICTNSFHAIIQVRSSTGYPRPRRRRSARSISATKTSSSDGSIGSNAGDRSRRPAPGRVSHLLRSPLHLHNHVQGGAEDGDVLAAGFRRGRREQPSQRPPFEPGSRQPHLQQGPGAVALLELRGTAQGDRACRRRSGPAGRSARPRPCSGW